MSLCPTPQRAPPNGVWGKEMDNISEYKTKKSWEWKTDRIYISHSITNLKIYHLSLLFNLKSFSLGRHKYYQLKRY